MCFFLAFLSVHFCSPLFSFPPSRDGLCYITHRLVLVFFYLLSLCVFNEFGEGIRIGCRPFRRMPLRWGAYKHTPLPWRYCEYPKNKSNIGGHLLDKELIFISYLTLLVWRRTAVFAWRHLFHPFWKTRCGDRTRTLLYLYFKVCIAAAGAAAVGRCLSVFHMNQKHTKPYRRREMGPTWMHQHQHQQQQC